MAGEAKTAVGFERACVGLAIADPVPIIAGVAAAVGGRDLQTDRCPFGALGFARPAAWEPPLASRSHTGVLRRHLAVAQLAGVELDIRLLVAQRAVLEEVVDADRAEQTTRVRIGRDELRRLRELTAAARVSASLRL